ncbi:TPA: helix-turn-helix transcriptional regulator [Pseudomonas aeruginosa]|nr:helix-turn-helix transcriptional regulator [Pseudomonas aeruginosa]NPS71898.1 helix-turn-helix transcriptional regulator [Pseudomonas aeruginosa]PQM07497.1 XRE family transcriptional regulator [Pseudomonas aeruginosa]TEE71690.1 XRE family transcriptional regulator [Pseudomonas aeruginosa]HEJ1395049.1 helix-turn-helix transcriptional regulator [Pseudomonas aeruginosa]
MSLDDVAAAFGKALRQKRKEAGLTQEELALQADVQRNYVSLIERGVNQPTITVIFKLAIPLRCSPSEIVASAERIFTQEKNQIKPNLSP